MSRIIAGALIYTHAVVVIWFGIRLNSNDLAGRNTFTPDLQLYVSTCFMFT